MIIKSRKRSIIKQEPAPKVVVEEEKDIETPIEEKPKVMKKKKNKCQLPFEEVLVEDNKIDEE